MINLFDLIFPKICSGCGSFGSYLCQGCIQDIKQGELICPNCEKASIGGAVHPLCKKRGGLDGLWSLGVYQDPLKKVIQKLKYRFVSEIAEVLVDLLIEYWARSGAYFLDEVKKDYGEGWVVVPVPLHQHRQNWRGFNQAALLGQIIASKIGLRYSECLKRDRPTKPQVGMDSKERKTNIRGAFSLSIDHVHQRWIGHWPKPITQNILLIDDVWTTGSTLKECCWVLKKGGAKKVWAITLAG